MDEIDKYASVLQYVNLPERRHLTTQQGLFQIPSGESFSEVNQAIKENTITLIQKCEKQFQVFVDPGQYQFMFPQSKFPDVPKGQRNTMSYEQKPIVEEEDTFKDRLSEEQVAQIAEKGQFEVKSSMQGVKIPYVWKINDIIFRGKNNIVNFWENGLSGCHSLITYGFQLIVDGIPKELVQIVALPKKFFSLIFGRRKLTSVYTPDYHREVIKDFWEDIMKNQLSEESKYIGKDFWQYLYLPYKAKYYQSIKNKDSKEYNELYKKQCEERSEYEGKVLVVDENKRKMREVEDKFDSNWQKIRKRVLQKISVDEEEEEMQGSEEEAFKKEKGDEENKIFDKFQQQKFNIYLAHLKEHLPKQNISLQIIQSLVILIHLVSLINKKIQLKNNKVAEIEVSIRNRIKAQHTIKSRDWNWLQRHVREQFEPIKAKIQEQFTNKFLQDPVLRQKFDEKYVSIYKKYVNFKFKFQALIKEKKQVIKPSYVPSRVFRTTYRLLPPYEVKKQTYYSLIKEKQMKVDTNQDFWKFKLYAMRMKSWTINCLVALIGFSWVGPFGFRCLYGIDSFKYDENINYRTGQKYQSERRTWIGSFLKVLQGIKNSRQHFQSEPDRGLFGKNIVRCLNYIQCYIFRLIFVGVIGVIIIYPLLIVLLSTICILMIVTFWAWVPLIMIVCYLFNILIFQFQSSYIPHGIVIRSVPLLSLALFLLKILFLTIWYMVFGMVIAPLLCTLYLLFLAIQRIFRTITDFIMLFLIKKLGRAPSRNSAIAKKISGPGMSRSYFMSIAEEDVYVLTQCHLQVMFYNKYLEKTRNAMEKSTHKYEQIMNYVLSPFGYYSASLNHEKDIVLNNKNKLQDNFNKQSNYYRNRYPKYPNRVRFTKEQIDNYFENSVKIVKNFVEKNKIQEWIFQDCHILDDDFDELTRFIWIAIFSCGDQIFQPLQNIDSRFKLEDLSVSNSGKMKKKVGSVMQALEGEVILSKDRVKFSPAKRSLLTKDYKIDLISQICSYHTKNAASSVNLDLQNPCSILAPHYNLGELRKIDIDSRQVNERNYENIIRE